MTVKFDSTQGFKKIHPKVKPYTSFEDNDRISQAALFNVKIFISARKEHNLSFFNSTIRICHVV